MPNQQYELTANNNIIDRLVSSAQRQLDAFVENMTPKQKDAAEKDLNKTGLARLSGFLDNSKNTTISGAGWVWNKVKEYKIPLMIIGGAVAWAAGHIGFHMSDYNVAAVAVGGAGLVSMGAGMGTLAWEMSKSVVLGGVLQSHREEYELKAIENNLMKIIPHEEVKKMKDNPEEMKERFNKLLEELELEHGEQNALQNYISRKQELDKQVKTDAFMRSAFKLVGLVGGAIALSSAVSSLGVIAGFVKFTGMSSIASTQLAVAAGTISTLAAPMWNSVKSTLSDQAQYDKLIEETLNPKKYTKAEYDAEVDAEVDARLAADRETREPVENEAMLKAFCKANGIPEEKAEQFAEQWLNSQRQNSKTSQNNSAAGGKLQSSVNNKSQNQTITEKRIADAVNKVKDNWDDFNENSMTRDLVKGISKNGMH